MGDPFSSEPTAPREHRKLLDRAHLLGDAGRAGRESVGEDAAEEFRSLLEGKASSKGRDRDQGPEEEAEELGLLEEERSVPREPTGALSAAELEARTEERGRDEAEKRLTAWRGPSPLAGLPAAAGLGLLAAGNVERGERSRHEGQAPLRTEIRPGEARVDAEVLQGLVDAGLARPVAGLDDPRLAGATPQLSADEGWHTAPTAHGVSFSWEGPGKSAWQRLEWGEGHALLESAAGSRLQVLERQGTQLFVRHAVREAPPAFPM